MVLTINEKRVLRLLAASAGKNYSINNIARECRLAPNGAYKILTKLEREGVLKAEPIANIKAYKLDFSNEKTVRLLELALMPGVLIGRVKMRADDMKSIKAVTQACILFGSYITTKKEPGDLDVLFVLKKISFETYKKTLAKIRDIMPVKIQDVVQTTEDILQNLKKSDPIVTAALREGVILWGYDVLVEVVRNASQ